MSSHINHTQQVSVPKATRIHTDITQWRIVYGINDGWSRLWILKCIQK